MSETRRTYDPRRGPPGAPWTAERVAALRATLSLSQVEFAAVIGVRQQTVSEWETGRYAPRGASARLLGLVAEDAAAYDSPAVSPVSEWEPGSYAARGESARPLGLVAEERAVYKAPPAPRDSLEPLDPSVRPDSLEPPGSPRATDAG